MVTASSAEEAQVPPRVSLILLLVVVVPVVLVLYILVSGLIPSLLEYLGLNISVNPRERENNWWIPPLWYSLAAATVWTSRRGHAWLRPNDPPITTTTTTTTTTTSTTTTTTTTTREGERLLLSPPLRYYLAAPTIRARRQEPAWLRPDDRRPRDRRGDDGRCRVDQAITHSAAREQVNTSLFYHRQT